MNQWLLKKVKPAIEKGGKSCESNEDVLLFQRLCRWFDASELGDDLSKYARGGIEFLDMHRLMEVREGFITQNQLMPLEQKI